jgi:drug/metabolite transporter (DMT)-like permease
VSLFLVGLLLVAATCHAAWNLLLKQAAERQAIIWAALVVTTACGLPVLLVVPGIGWHGLILAAISAVVEVGYYRALVSAYGVGDFSLVYPLARGVAPALLALWSVIFLGERPAAAGVLGIALVVAGLVVTGAPRGARGRVGAVIPAGAGLALLVALLISTYSAIDGGAVKRADSLGYGVAIFGLTTLLLTPVVARSPGWARVGAAVAAHRRTVVIVGVLQAVGYGIVLWVYARGPVSYAGAIRESSIVIGAIAGWIWLSEGFGVQRAIGALLMFAGVACIAAGG